MSEGESALERLATRLIAGSGSLPVPTQIASGDAAAARGRALLVDSYGSNEQLDIELRKAGRPRVGEPPKGPSPTVRSRIPARDYAALVSLREHTGKSESELIREAIHAVLLDAGLLNSTPNASNEEPHKTRARKKVTPSP